MVALASVVSKELAELEAGETDELYLDFARTREPGANLERALNFARAFIDAQGYPFELMRHPFRPSFAVWRRGEPCPIYPEVIT